LSEMPTEAPTETPGEKTLRRFYEGRLADRLIQVASMERNRALLRRGARKMQDGTLGQCGDLTEEEEPLNISIGDQIHYHAALPATATSGATSETDKPLWKRLAILAAIMAATGGSAGLATYLAVPAAEALPVAEQGAEAIMPPGSGYGVEVEKAAPDATTPPCLSF